MSGPITVEIAEPRTHQRFEEMEKFLGPAKYHLYRKGTDSRWFVDFMDRTRADLAVANLNANQFDAHIVGD